MREIDRIYLNKVRERLYRTRIPQRDNSSYSDRDKETEIRRFAWTEERLQRFPSDIDAAREHFIAAIAMFNRGLYSRAVDLFEVAVEKARPSSPLGGQYQLWLAQALDAAGERKAATLLLEMLQNHEDPDCRRVAAELHFIMTAPRLELEPGAFVSIPQLDERMHNSSARIVAAGLGQRLSQRRKKVPEKYSLEWYMEKKKPHERPSNDWLLLSVAVVGIGAFLFSAWGVS